MMTFKSKRARSLVFAIVFVFGLGGCGTVFGDTCERQAECEGGNDLDIDACVAGFEGSADVAAAYDCGDPFDKLVDCFDRTGNCDSNDYKTNCDDEEDALKKCQEAASAR